MFHFLTFEQSSCLATGRTELSSSQRLITCDSAQIKNTQIKNESDRLLPKDASISTELQNALSNLELNYLSYLANKKEWPKQLLVLLFDDRFSPARNVSPLNKLSAQQQATEVKYSLQHRSVQI